MVVVAGRYGQLGNRLFLFGHLIAAAAEHGFRVWNPAFGEYADLFASTAGDPLCRYPPPRRRLPAPAAAALREAAYLAARDGARVSLALGLSGRLHRVVRLNHEDGPFDLGVPSFVAAARRMPVLIEGWLFRDDASFEKHASLVRAHFRPLDAHERRVATLLDRARAGAPLLVGVHVRRGDYRRFMGGRFLFDDATYARLMHATRELLAERDVRFLLCADEPVADNCFRGLDVVRGTGHALEDLYALAGCDYVLGPPSTYTGWASFYGRVPLFSVREPGAQPRLEDFSVSAG